MTARNKNIPVLRFKDFNGKWEVELLGNTCEVKTGDKDTQNKVEDGKYPFFIRSNTVERINSYSFDGEAILTSGDGVGVGKNFHYINGKFDYHQRVYALRDFKKKYNAKFIYQVFVEKFYKRVIRLSAKNSVDSVRMNMITEMEIHFPSLPEQQKIASFLSAIDEKIRQLSRRRELLEQYKKGVMQQLFSGKLRFRDEKGKVYPKWEEKELREVAEFSKGKGISKLDIDVGGDTECIRYGQLYTDYRETISKVISRTNMPIENLVLSEENDVIIPASGETQIDIATASCVLRSGIALGSDLNIIRSKMNGVFLSYYLNSHKKFEIAKLSQGITVVHLYPSQLGLLKLFIPFVKEQQKIATFLSSLDTKIESVSAQIARTQEFKKGLLQEMFV